MDDHPDPDENQDQPGEANPPRQPPAANLQIDYDAVLNFVGGWGLYQRLLYHLICLQVVVTTQNLFTMNVFSLAEPHFRCHVDACDSAIDAKYSDAFDKHFCNFTMPPKSGTSQCQQYSFLNFTPDVSNQCSDDHFSQSTLVDCNKWIFDKTEYEASLVSELNLVCDEEWKVTTAQTIYFSGVFVAASLSGTLADKFGRRHISMICITISALSSLALIFITDYYAYLVFLFIISMAQTGVFLVAFVLVMEMVGFENRVYCGILIEIYFVLGELLSVGLSVWMRNWRKVMMIVTGPLFMFILYWPFLPESSRWLLAKGKIEEAQAETNRISYWNKRAVVNIKTFKLPESRRLRDDVNLGDETFFKMIKEWTLLKRLLILCYTWLIITLAYYGLTLSSVSLSGDPYLNFFLVSLVEIPGNIASFILLDRIGRKYTMVVSLIIASIALLINGGLHLSSEVVHEGATFWAILVTNLIGKCFVTSGFSSVYIYTSELFPTASRSTSVGLCSTTGRIGAIITPAIAQKAKRNPSIPMFIFGITSLIGGILNLLLPETLGHHLPETIEQAKDLDTPTNREPRHGEDAGERQPLLA